MSLNDISEFEEKQKDAQVFFNKTIKYFADKCVYEKMKIIHTLIKHSNPIYQLIDYVMKNDKEFNNKEKRHPFDILISVIEYTPEYYLINFFDVILNKIIWKLCDEPVNYKNGQLVTRGLIIHLYNIGYNNAYDWQKKILTLYYNTN